MTNNNMAGGAAGPFGRFKGYLTEFQTGIRALRWGPVLLFGIGAGLLMPVALSQAGTLAFVAGIVPVGVGYLIARTVQQHHWVHGLVAGVIAAITAAILLAFLVFYTSFGTNGNSLAAAGGSLLGIWATTTSFIAFSLIVFSTFGASTGGRAAVRNQELARQQQERGGSLERPSVIREPEDLRGLSLPQLGSYVNDLFRKKGFEFIDYKFIDKDKHLDLWMRYEKELYHIRTSVADKIPPGTIESLVQEMKREGAQKGIVIASTEFTPAAAKSAKDRRVVLIDGATLYQIAEK